MIGLPRKPISHILKLCWRFSKSEVPIDSAKNYYQILDIAKTAELPEIKRSFYEKAKQFHPDSAPGNEEKFKLITEAYNVLSNDEYRRKYDRMRPAEKDDGDIPSGEEYMNYMNKTTRKKTAAEWSKVRRGIRSQEESYQNNMNIFLRGSFSDQSIIYFAVKQKMREQWMKQTNQKSLNKNQSPKSRENSYKSDEKIEQQPQSMQNEKNRQHQVGLFRKLYYNLKSTREKIKQLLWSSEKK